MPRDVQRDVLAFAEDFVSDQNLTSLSVLDVKDGISSALGDRCPDVMHLHNQPPPSPASPHDSTTTKCAGCDAA